MVYRILWKALRVPGCYITEAALIFLGRLGILVSGVMAIGGILYYLLFP